MGNYSSAVAKSSLERRQFLSLLQHTIGVLPNPPAPELIQLYASSFERIGYPIGIKGLKTYIVHSLGSKLPTVAELAELGGEPMTSKIELKDIPDIIASRIRECIHAHEETKIVREYESKSNTSVLKTTGKDIEEMVKQKAGMIGLKGFTTLGGIRTFKECKEKDLPFIFSNLKSLINSFIKENPKHDEIKYHLQGRSNEIYKLVPNLSADVSIKNKLKLFIKGHPRWLLGLEECRKVRKELGSNKTLNELVNEKYYTKKI